MLQGFWAALAFLTRLPVPRWLVPPWDQFGQALRWFPVVGLILGVILAGLDLGLGLAAPSLLASILVVVAWAGLTGGLHLDGLADTGDALLAPMPTERRLEVMRDPRIGTFGTLALVSVLLLKVAALDASVPIHVRLGMLLLAPTAARWAIVWGAWRHPYGRAEGLGSPLKRGATWPALALATAVPLAVALALGPLGLAALAVAAVGAVTLCWLIARALPGLTGDTYGAVCEITEAVTLVAMVVLSPLLLG